MKAISIKSPWWEKIIAGEKQIEIRTWKTNYRGPLLICAAKPEGKAIAIVELVDVRRMTLLDEKSACIAIYPGAYAWVLKNVREIEPFPVRGMPGIFEINYKEKI